MKVSVSHGFPASERALAARLYWQAFGPKLGRVLGPQDRALRFLEDILDPDFAIAARDVSGTLLGLAGVKTAEGGLVSGGMSDLARHYGWFGAVWRAALLSVLERDLQPGILQMDGICVADHARGQGVGTALLEAVADLARHRGLNEVQLDVIDTNPRAQALYERAGFKAVSTENTGVLKPIFGFGAATRMTRSLA